MPKPRKAPPKDVLQEFISRGLTQQEMAEEWSRQTGQKVARSTISVAMAREGLTTTTRERFGDLLPWSLSAEHRYHRDARYLRLEARRGRGGHLSDAELRRLEAWKLELAERNAVIYYDRDSPGGWWWIKRQPIDEYLIRHPKDVVPWDVKPEHRDADEYEMLMLEMRRRLGDDLDPAARKQLGAFMADLDARDVVIVYGPRKGWGQEPATEADGDVVRLPRKRSDRQWVRPEIESN